VDEKREKPQYKPLKDQAGLYAFTYVEPDTAARRRVRDADREISESIEQDEKKSEAKASS